MEKPLELVRPGWRSVSAVADFPGARLVETLQENLKTANVPAQGDPQFLKKLHALRGEKSAEIFFYSLLTLARNERTQGGESRAQIIFNFLITHATEPEIRELASAELGAGGVRFENILGRFASEATDARTLVPMIIGTAAYHVTRSLALARFASPALGGITKFQKLAVGVLGSAVEISSFAVVSRLLRVPSGDTPEQSFSQDLVGSALLLGAMKLGGWLSQKGFRRFHGVDAFGRATRWREFSKISAELFPLAATTMSIHVFHPEHRQANSWLESLAAGLNLSVGAHLGRRLLGPGLNRFELESEFRSRQKPVLLPVAAPVPAFVHPTLSPWFASASLMVGMGSGGMPPPGMSKRKAGALRKKIADAYQPFYRPISSEAAGRAELAWRQIEKTNRGRLYWVDMMNDWVADWREGIDPMVTLHNTGASAEQVVRLLSGLAVGNFPLNLIRRLDLPEKYFQQAIKRFALDRHLPGRTLDLTLPLSELVLWLADHVPAWAYPEASGGFPNIEVAALRKLIRHAPSVGSVKILEIPSRKIHPKLPPLLATALRELKLPPETIVRGEGLFFETILGMGEPDRSQALNQWSRPLSHELKKQQERLTKLLEEGVWAGLKDKSEDEFYSELSLAIEREMQKWNSPYPIYPLIAKVRDRVLQRLKQERGIDLTGSKPEGLFSLALPALGTEAFSDGASFGSVALALGLGVLAMTVAKKDLKMLRREVGALFVHFSRELISWMLKRGEPVSRIPVPAAAAKALGLPKNAYLEQLGSDGYAVALFPQETGFPADARNPNLDASGSYQNFTLLREVSAGQWRRLTHEELLALIPGNPEIKPELIMPESLQGDGKLAAGRRLVDSLESIAGFEKNYQVKAGEQVFPLQMFVEAGDQLEYTQAWKKVRAALRLIPIPAFSVFREVEAYAGPSQEYGFAGESAHFLPSIGLIRLFDLENKTTCEILDDLRHEAVGHGMVRRHRDPNEIAKIKLATLAAIQAGGDRADWFFQQMLSGRALFARNWEERLAEGLSLYLVDPNFFREKADPHLSRVIDDLLLGFFNS